MCIRCSIFRRVCVHLLVCEAVAEGADQWDVINFDLGFVVGPSCPQWQDVVWSVTSLLSPFSMATVLIAML